MRSIYLDYMATTPVSEEVARAMLSCLSETGNFGNPASSWHEYGYYARDIVQKAAGQVAGLIGASPEEIVWTSGATEANNLAIKGSVDFYKRKGKHIITMQTEHASVSAVCRFLETQGYSISYLPAKLDGRLDLAVLQKSLRLDTVLVSIMHANSETGVLQDLAAISEMAHSVGALFHTDAAQSVGKVPIDVRKMGIDLLSCSAHKLYGPKGIGALFVSQNPRIRLTPQVHGGGQQNSLRSGTLPVHQIVGFGMACERMLNSIEARNSALWHKREVFLGKLKREIPELHFYGNAVYCLPHCVNFSVEGVDFELFVGAIKSKIALSIGSACNNAVFHPSSVLLGMGVDREHARSAIRLSFSEYTTEADLNYAIEVLSTAFRKLSKGAGLHVWETAAQNAWEKMQGNGQVGRKN